MNSVIENSLQPGEKVLAETAGRTEIGAFGGAMFPAQEVLIATDKRVLVFLKVHGSPLEFEREIPYESIEKLSVYRDVLGNGLAGLLAGVLHLQDGGGNLIRLVGPIHVKPFLDAVRRRTTIRVKG